MVVFLASAIAGGDSLSLLLQPGMLDKVKQENKVSVQSYKGAWIISVHNEARDASEPVFLN